MINQLQFPFKYDKKKSRAENRHEFKDFFLCLTNIRCAVVEGGHHCEAACRTLQGFKLNDPIPLEQKHVQVPESSTIFKQIATHVYYCKDKETPLNQEHTNHLKGYSTKIANDKEKIVRPTWHYCFQMIGDDITKKGNLQSRLYQTQANFYQEEVKYTDLTDSGVPSYMIKHYLHEVLTHAIFNYGPCTNLLGTYKKDKPTPETWGIPSKNKWLLLSVEPFQHVSKNGIQKLEYFYFLYLILIVPSIQKLENF